MSAEQQDPQAPPALPLVKDDRFEEVLALIQGARQRVTQAVNTQLIDLYWQVGAYISRKLERAEWGDSVVSQLAAHLAQTQPVYVVLPGLTCFVCVNSTRRIAMMKKSQHC